MSLPRLVLLAPALLSAAPASAQSLKLNDPLARAARGRVESFDLTPDGARAVFVADLSATGDVLHLFSTAVDGSTPLVQLSGPPLDIVPEDARISADGSRAFYLQLSNAQRLYVVPLDGSAAPAPVSVVLPPGNVVDYELAPAGGRVVYLADQDSDEVFELYSRPQDLGAPPVKLSGPTVAGGDVQSGFRITPDGTHVVYRADQDADNVIDLYGVPIDGSAAPVRLNLTRPNADVQDDFALAWDSLGVVYRSDQDADDVFELYSARVDGAFASVKRSGALVAGGDVRSFRLSRVNDRLLYLADQVTDDVVELYSVHAITGGTPVKLNGTLVAGGDVSEAQLSADATRVVYRADQLTNGVDALFGAPANGASAAVPLSTPVAGHALHSFQVPDSGARVLYTLGEFVQSDLYSAPLDGSQPQVRLNQELPIGALGCVVQDVLADGTVIFTADALTAGHRELFSVPADGSANPRALDGPLVSGGQVVAASASADGSRVVYQAARDHSDAQELFSVPTNGSPTLRLSGPLPLGAPAGAVDRFDLSADGAHAVYVAREDSLAAFDLYGVATDGSGHSTQLHLPLSAGDFVGQFLPSPDGTRVAFELTRSGANTVELHCAPVDAFRGSVRIDEPSSLGSGSFQRVVRFAFTPDSSHVVFTADHDTDDVYELYRAPSDGGQPPVRLHPPLLPQQDVGSFEFSPDGAWVVYLLSSPDGAELYGLPLDGHQPPARLNAPLVPGGGIGGDQEFAFLYPFQIAPGSDRVVYMADQDTDDVTELYMAPIDGSAAPLKLNGAFGADADVCTDVGEPNSNPPFRISPDGTRVVYRADQEQDERRELYSVPITGGAPVKLNGALVAGGSVRHFAIDAGSTLVVYVAAEAPNGGPQLFSVPLTGGTRVLVSAGSGSVVTDTDRGAPFRLGALGRVAFLRQSGGSTELWSAPLDGSAAPQRLSATLPPGGSVLADFGLTPDGATAIYVADQLVSETFELFAVPLDASRPPRRISGEMVPGGDVLVDRGSFLIAGDGSRVVYRADQDTDGVPELYAALLDFQRGPRRAGAPTWTVVR